MGCSCGKGDKKVVGKRSAKLTTLSHQTEQELQRDGVEDVKHVDANQIGILMMNAQLNSLASFLSKLVNGRKRRQFVKINTINTNDENKLNANYAGGGAKSPSSSSSSSSLSLSSSSSSYSNGATDQLQFLTTRINKSNEDKKSINQVSSCSSSSSTNEFRSKLEPGSKLTGSPSGSIIGSLVGGGNGLIMGIGAAECRRNADVIINSTATATATITVTAADADAADDASNGNRLAKEEINLFTSIQQLCYETISEKLIKKVECSADQDQTKNSKVLCLFVFGCQGSGKGEIAYDLVQHSALHRSLFELQSSSLSSHELNDDAHQGELCPLYHHIDVATLIIANIDSRINEYKTLLRRTIKHRKEQLALCEGKAGPEVALGADDDDDDDDLSKEGIDDYLDCEFEEDEEEEEEEEEELKGKGEIFKVDSVNLLINDVPTSSIRHYSHNQFDEFGQITLSTKQRSILQLKLMKYFNSVTTKWMFNLIKEEIDKLESMFEKRKESPSFLFKNGKQNRVYLINLIPNQLSLFKSCLYLHQNLNLKHNFNYPYYAIKFERRTNIKLLTKDKSHPKSVSANNNNNNKTGRSKQLTTTGRNLHLKLSNIRLPILSGSTTTTTTKPANDKEKQRQSNDRSFSAMASNLIAVTAKSKENEKLGPKFNENFSQQFKSIDKLIVMRYNPIKDYNYANQDDDDDENDDNAGFYHPQRSASLPINQSDSQPTTNRIPCSRILALQRQPEENASPNFLTTARALSRIISSSMQNLPLINVEEQQPRSAGNFNVSPATSPTLSPTWTMKSAINDHFSTAESNALSESSSHNGSSNNSRRSSRQSQLTTGSGLISASSVAVKSAIEFELFDSSSSAQAEGLSDEIQSISKLSLPVYFQEHHHEQEHRSNSRPIFQFASSNQRKKKNPSGPNSTDQGEQSKKGNGNCYKLILARIAYANDQSKILQEAKRYHSRLVKLKGQSDLNKLMKVYSKARKQLQDDCQNWLHEAIIKHNHNQPQSQLPVNLHHHQSSAHRKRHSISTSDINQSLMMSNQQQQQQHQVAMIVYSIKIDISCIKSNQFQFPSNFKRSLSNSSSGGSFKEMAKSQKAATNFSPTSISQLSISSIDPKQQQQQQQQQRPVSCRSTIVKSATRLSTKPKRHVQFKLNQAPESEKFILNNSIMCLKTQHRKWLSDNLFLSSTEDGSIALIELLAELLKYSMKIHRVSA